MALSDFFWKRNDTAESVVIEAVYADGSPVQEDFDGATVKFHMATSNGTTVLIPQDGVAGSGDAELITNYDADAGTPARLGFQPIDGDTATASTPDAPHIAEFEVTLADGRILTFPNASNLLVHIFPDIA